MYKTLPFAALVVTSLALAGCGYTPEQRAASGAALGGATGAALGQPQRRRRRGACRRRDRRGDRRDRRRQYAAPASACLLPAPPPPPRVAPVGAMTPMAIQSAWAITATENYRY